MDAARGAYAALVADRTILRFLMHANCAAGEPLVGQAVRRCYAKQVDTVRQLLGDDDAVRRWFGTVEATRLDRDRPDALKAANTDVQAAVGLE